MISCLTVTQEGKLAELERSILCFDSQTLPDRELVIVHDGTEEYDHSVRELASRFPSSTIIIEQVGQGLTLGALRNLSVERASFDLVCQWDDDDLYHPKRLEAQFERLSRENADFCFMTDQLHLFEDSGELYWDDWTVEEYPMSLIQGTVLGRKSLLGTYADLDRGEDTPVVVGLVEAGHRIAQLAGQAYLYVYVFNGRNAWDFEHHAEISSWKRLPMTRLLEKKTELKRRLGEYPILGRILRMPHEEGGIFVQIGSLSESISS